MRRRAYLGTLGAATVCGAVGFGLVSAEETLSTPSVDADGPRRKALVFESDGTEVASFGAQGTVRGDRIDVETELWHRSDTLVERIELRVAMPAEDGGTATDVAVTSPLQGDSSPPPALTLSVPRDDPGTVLEVTDLDDLADETISTIGFVVTPRSEASGTLTVETRVALESTAVLASDYALHGSLDLSFPSFA